MTFQLRYYLDHVEDALDGHYARKNRPAISRLLRDLMLFCKVRRINFDTALASARVQFQSLKVST